MFAFMGKSQSLNFRIYIIYDNVAVYFFFNENDNKNFS